MFQRVSGTKLYEEVIRQIKDMIAQGQYAQGQRLPSEKELMEMMGVSRVTVREALRILANMGIIETQKGRGSLEAARLASPGDVRRLESLIDGDPGKIAAGSENMEMDEFHLCLLRMVDDKLLLELFQKLLTLENTPMKVPMITPEHQEQVAKTICLQHRRIYEAVRDHNQEFAYFYMKEHVSFLFDAYRNYFQCFFE